MTGGKKGMNWIRDLKNEIRTIELSRKNLKRFTYTICGFSIIISVGGFLKFLSLYIGGMMILFALSLAASFFFFPCLLQRIYIYWMSFSMMIGWFISRFLLIIMYYMIITPVGVIARIAGKKFLDTGFRSDRASYWIRRDKPSPRNYKKMY